MIKIAQRKMRSLNQANRLILFPEEFEFVKKYNEVITTLLKQNNYYYEHPKFLVSDLYHLPFKNDKFDHINCCGSVLGLVRDIDSALIEMNRLLKVDGTVFIEVDSRWSLDTLWMMLDYFFLHKLGFHTSRNDVNKIIFSSILKDIIVDYPYGVYEGFPDKNYKIKLKLFSPFALPKKFCLYNMKVLKKWNIHSITNLLPSTILDKDNPSNKVKKIFMMLSSLEEMMPNLIPGCSTVYLLKKIR
jgi:SAM-dependent methyltransferase